MVMIDQPIKKSMSKPEVVGRMIQWTIELSQLDIEYHPRTAIKAQALVDFITEFTLPDKDNHSNKIEQWTIRTDGLLAQKRGEVGVVIITPDREMIKYGVQLKFPTTNNEVEYEGILTGLRVRKALEAKNLLLQSDSMLVIGQIKEEYEAKEERKQKYLKLTKRLTQEFNKVEFVQILRSQNIIVDEITKLALSEERSTSTGSETEIPKHPSIKEVSTFVI